MSDNAGQFTADKLTIIEFKMVKGQVDVPEDFNHDVIEGHNLNKSLEIHLNLTEKLVKVDFRAHIKSDSKGGNEMEAVGIFHLVFLYQVENLNELTKSKEGSLIELEPALVNVLSSITYSTSRGVLLSKLQGTALQYFILPITNPSDLLQRK